MSLQELCATFYFVSISSSIPWYTISSTPGMSFATSTSCFPVFVSSLIFFTFFQHRYSLMLFYLWRKIPPHSQMEKQSLQGGFHPLLIFASLFRQSNIFIFILFCGCFCCCFFSFSCSTISSVGVSSSSISGSLSTLLHTPLAYTFLA